MTKAFDGGQTQILSDELQLIEMIQITNFTIQLMSSLKEKASNLVNQLTTGDAQQKQTIFHSLVKQIKLSDGELAIDLSRRELRSQLLPPDSSLSSSNEGSDDCSLTLPFTLKRRGVEAKLIIGLSKETAACVDDNLVRVIAKSHAWFDALSKGRAQSIRHLAETEGVSENDVSRSLQLAFLAPSIVEQVLAGKQPVELTSQTLKSVGELPFCWHRQSNQFGCHSHAIRLRQYPKIHPPKFWTSNLLRETQGEIGPIFHSYARLPSRRLRSHSL